MHVLAVLVMLFVLYIWSWKEKSLAKKLVVTTIVLAVSVAYLVGTCKFRAG